jgi:NADH-quinone oxidoreductase subunit M
VASWNRVQDAPRFYYSLLLLLQCATLGVFCALDTVLFFVFWELTLVPLYFLLARWGVTTGSARAAARYFLIMLAAACPAACLRAACRQPAGADLRPAGAAGRAVAADTQYAVFLLCLAGFGVKVPLVPLHTWLPQFALAAPGSLTALLVGLKLGAYGLIRFAIPLAPDAAQDLHWLLAGFGTLTLIYGA